MDAVLAEMVWEITNARLEIYVSVFYDNERFNRKGKKIIESSGWAQRLGIRKLLAGWVIFPHPANSLKLLAGSDLCGFLHQHFGLADRGIIDQPPVQGHSPFTFGGRLFHGFDNALGLGDIGL